MTSTTAPQDLAPSSIRSRWGRSPVLTDGLFLVALVALSALLYVGRLGFSSDDWDFLAVLSTAPDRSVLGLVGEQIEGNPNLAMRPTQAAYQALLFRAFGLTPLGYHVVNLVVLAGVALLLYLVLRRLRFPRGVAVSIPAVYATMPNYSTTRFWFASFGYLLGMAFYLVGLNADLRAATSDRPRRTWGWKAVALASLALAAFGYEVVVPFFLLNIVLVEIVARRERPRGLRARLGPVGVAVFHGSTLALIAVAAAYKASVALGVGLGGSPLRYALWLGSSTVATNFGTFGVGLPHTVGWSIPHASVVGALIAVVAGIGTYGYLRGLPGGGGERTHLDTGWMGLILAGLGVFLLGYAIFLTSGRIGFSSTGIANRVATAGALGAAIVLVGAVGWVAGRWRAPASRDRAFRVGVAVLCAAGVLVVNGLSSFWVRSWQEQREVLSEVDAALPELPRGSTVLLQGVCPYIGPAIVFESSWDLRGALRVRHGDRSLEGDVTSGRVAVEPHGVVTGIYHIEVTHPYGDHLFLYDRRTRTVTVLTDEETAARSVSSDATEGCPEGEPGVGALVLPFDAAFRWFQSRVGS
jgi:hypothetical protein